MEPELDLDGDYEELQGTPKVRFVQDGHSFDGAGNYLGEWSR